MREPTTEHGENMIEPSTNGFQYVSVSYSLIALRSTCTCSMTLPVANHPNQSSSPSVGDPSTPFQRFHTTQPAFSMPKPDASGGRGHGEAQVRQVRGPLGRSISRRRLGRDESSEEEHVERQNPTGGCVEVDTGRCSCLVG